MGELVKVVVDAMGGDNAPVEIVKGAIDAVNENENVKVILAGPEEQVKDELAKYQYDRSRVEILNATEVIEVDEAPVMAIRKKKDSSIVLGLKMIRTRARMHLFQQEAPGQYLLADSLLQAEFMGLREHRLLRLFLQRQAALCFWIPVQM